MEKLLLIGSNCAHTVNYYQLIRNDISEIHLFTDHLSDSIPSTEFDFSLKRAGTLLRRIREIRRAIINFNPQVIHVHQANAFAFLAIKAAKGLNIPTVITLWGSDVLIMPKRNVLLKKMFRYIVEHSDAITADAVVLATEAQKYTPKKLEVAIVNYGIDFLPLNTEKEHIIYSNRLHKPLYRIQKIVEDFIAAGHLHPYWKLLIGATGSETGHLKHLAAKSPTTPISFCGWLDPCENNANYARAKFYVSIPESDGTSISLLEAMYYGCVPVVSDLPANHEWITDGKNGIILKEGESVFDRLTEINLEEARQINQHLVMAKADKAKNKAVFLNLYKSLLN